MVNDDSIAIAANPIGFDDDTGIGSMDRSPFVDTNIDTAMINSRTENRMRPIAVVRRNDTVYRPNESS